MSDEPVTISEIGADLKELADELTRAFTAVLSISALGALSLGGSFRGVLFAELLGKMHSYKMEQARGLALTRPEMVERLNHEVEAIWPILKAHIDKDIAAAAELVRELRGEEVH